MAAGGGRELLALIHQHLLRGGFARAARELQAQTGQKLLPSLSTSLEDIFTHWEKTPPNSRRRKLSYDEAAIPEKIRVPDPVSSSESSEKEEDEKEKAKAANAASLSLATNSAVTVESSEEDESSSEEETPAGKGAVTVTPAVVGGKAANSLHSPPKPTAPAGRAAALPAPDRTVLSNNKQQPNAVAAAPAPAKAQKLPASGKPRHATAATAKVGQSKAPESSSSSSSSSSESEEERETPTAKAPAPKAEPKQAAGAAESSSEESSEDTSSEEEEEQLATPAVQAKPAVKAAQFNATPVKSAPAAPVSHKKSAVKQTALAPSQSKPTSTTVPGAAQPDDTSESSSSSDSEDEELPSVTQTKPPPNSSQAVPSPVKPTPAASLSVKASPAKTLPVSQGKPAPKTAVPKQAKTPLGRTAAPTKPAESTKPVESSDSSDSEEEDLPVPISQKRLTEQPGPVPNLSQPAKAGPPEKAVGSTLKSQVSESGSSDSSDSEEESPAAQRQPPQAVKTNSVPQPTNVKKAPTSAPATAPPAVDSSDDSSEESDSENEIVPPSQSLPHQNVKVSPGLSTVAAKANATLSLGKRVKTPAVPPVSRVSESFSTDSSEHSVLAGKAPAASSLKQTVPVGKAPPANTATPQAALLPGSSTAKGKKPGLQAVQNAQLSQATLPTPAEDTSDSSSSSDSDEEEVPKQPPKTAGSLQKPEVTQPAHSSSSESSDEEEAASQSLLTGYLGFSKAPAAPQAPKTVSPQPVGEVGPGKAAVTAANSPAKAPLKAAPADSSSSDSSDSDTDDNQVAANHKAENNPPSGQEATEASNKEKVAGKTEPGHASLKASLKKGKREAKENDVGAKEVQVTPAPSHALLSVPQSGEPSSRSETEVTTAAKVPAVQGGEGLEVKKKRKKEKKEKKEKKPSSTADKAVKMSKGKDKENKKQKTSQKRKLAGEDGAVGQSKEKKRKGQANEEVPKKKKKKADGDLEKTAGSKEKKKPAKKKKTGKERKKSKKVSFEGEPVADGSTEVPKKKKKKKKTAEPEGL
ncbi:treacle protein isoform X1 [Myiozetetes cayanensis]|uniref:treacle protein isoform X1 n=1 Tax=Myiozetetes cayanensis TaxID=478635 RepID=UPI00215DE194|nr:treacle protein isoform X1 [Myiozetetes cayanensis]XP_050167950.1 treacle protein isoform X1 [Myiozetetes cayanensis]